MHEEKLRNHTKFFINKLQWTNYVCQRLKYQKNLELSLLKLDCIGLSQKKSSCIGSIPVKGFKGFSPFWKVYSQDKGALAVRECYRINVYGDVGL